MPCYSSCAFCCTAGSGPGRSVTPRSGVGFHLPLWRELCNPIPSPLPPQRLSSGVIVYRANRDRSKDLASEVRGSMLTVRWSTVGFSWFVVMVTGTHDWEFMMLHDETKGWRRAAPLHPSWTLDALFPQPREAGREVRGSRCGSVRTSAVRANTSQHLTPLLPPLSCLHGSVADNRNNILLREFDTQT